eukprot:gene8980-1313_t
MKQQSLRLVLAFAVSITISLGSDRPNIVIILTDDQDLLLNSTLYMPNLKHLIIDQGMSFSYGLANSPVCCPSRSSLLTGRYIHNHGAVNNSAQGNCVGDDWKNTIEKDALAVHMKAAGYRTLYAGKYLNNYFGDYIPPGWTDWYGLHGNSRYYNYTMQNNNKTEKHGDKYDEDYLTDVLARRALQFLNETSHDAQHPFLLWIGTPSAHASFTPAPQYVDSVTEIKAPRTPNYNHVYPDRHQPVRDVQPMTAMQIQQSDEIFRKRLETLRSVDDMIGDIVHSLEKLGQLDNTFFFYTSDHGFHLGQFGMGFDKRQLYETDIRVPYFVRGPGIAAGVSREEPISHVDLSPTIIDIVTGSVPSNWDGRSFKQLLLDQHAIWKEENMIQYFGEGPAEEFCGAFIMKYLSDNNTCWYEGKYTPALCDGVNNTYTCIRRLNTSAGINDIFCMFDCFDLARQPLPCPTNKAEGYGEYYDLSKDPWQTKNAANSLPAEKRSNFIEKINHLKNCKGQKECQGFSLLV